jgi:hypothetical protein
LESSPADTVYGKSLPVVRRIVSVDHR